MSPEKAKSPISNTVPKEFKFAWNPKPSKDLSPTAPTVSIRVKSPRKFTKESNSKPEIVPSVEEALNSVKLVPKKRFSYEEILNAVKSDICK